MDKKILLTRLKQAIISRIGIDRFKGIVLFGSEARSTPTEHSDIDIIVLLNGPVLLGQDLQEVISATYGIQLEIDRCLHFVVADYEEYNRSEFSLYRTIKNEGVAV